MPVSGRELASLDFANLIGGPLNAVVEAQAKSAITTANFIREIGFTKEGNVVNVDFTYNRKNDNGSDQEFTLTLPFLMMLPVPYITVNKAVIEFNAKITSTTESSSESNFSQQVEASAGGRCWFVSAKVTSKTAYQKKSATSDREERTFDMHVLVEAGNQDMPAGTERIFTLLENSITERTTHKLLSVALLVTDIEASQNVITAEGADIPSLKQDDKFTFDGKDYKLTAVPTGVQDQPTKWALKVDPAPVQSMVNKTIEIKH
jgi:hypothetical protein